MARKKSTPPAQAVPTARQTNAPIDRVMAEVPVNSKKSAGNPKSQSKAKPAAKKRAATPPVQSKSFPIVGIGASAGGLEAFKQLFEHLPVDTGMAFVLVSHLDPTHKSILAELIARGTRMPVSEVREGMKVKPNHVYVMPPNTGLTIAAGVLRLRPREEGRAGRHPVDYFLRTLSEDQSHRAIGVILSGTDSDGTLGLEAIKAEGGITFAQDSKSAKYDSMPRNAAASGHVDFILTPEGIAKELARISRHPYVAPVAATSVDNEQPLTGRDGFRKVLMLLRKARDVDFTDYKANTLHRRITRRMVLNKLDSLDDYAQYLRENAAEVEALYQDILINVTSFFRNPETFAVLKEKIFPRIVQQRTPDEPIRIWTLGCSTGQEAYSIAMSFVEFIGDQAEHIPVQIFATDLSDKGIEKARAGLYPKDITDEVSPERLRRFFTESEGGYRVSKPIRDMVIFARQNVITDPPFSRLDLISCRNLLIYLEPVLQKKVLPALHYALKPTGVLWLGTSETPGSSSDLFAPEDKKHRFYSKKLTSSRMHFQSSRGSAPGNAARDRADSGQRTNYMSEQLRTEHDAQKEADRILLARYSPAGVVINAEMEILQFRGSTGAYLESPAGKATLNLLKMAREGLMLPLRAAIQKAKKEDATIRKEGLRINHDGEFRQVNLEVIPIKGLAANERSFLVLFEPATEDIRQPVAGSRRKAEGGKRQAGDQLARLQEELSVTREYLQSLVEQYEAANEELQSSSEEIQSSNEELQSINEEMETAKEELESSNEELTTLNDELQNRNQELTTLNEDQNNLFSSVSLPILMLGRDLRIRRFTPQAEKVLSLIVTDVGRPVGDIKHKLNIPDLGALITEVIDTVSIKEREVQDTEGRWYAMRIRPYLTLDNKIDGAVVVLVDVDALKRSEAAISESRDYSEAIVRTTPNPLLILNTDLRVYTANEAFYSTFKISPDEAEGRLIYDLGNRQWNIPKLRELLEDILPRNNFFNNFEVTHDFESIGQRSMLLNARRLDDTDGVPARILLGIQDVTELLRFQAEMRRSEIRYRRLFEAAKDGVLLIDPQTRKIIDANPFMTELLGYTREELLGREMFEIGLLKDEEASREAFRELQEHGFIRYDDLPLEAKTGGRRDVEMVSNLYNEDGEKIIQCNIRDITERKLAVHALRESEERYRRLFDSIDEGFCLIEKVPSEPGEPIDFRYIEANPAFAVKSGLRDVVGKTIRQVVPGEPEEWFETYDNVLRTGEPVRFERELVSQGRVLDLYAVRIEDGTNRRVAVVFSDITERRQAGEERERLLSSERQARGEAEEANRLKDEFLATVSHELRAPLNAILGWSNILVRGGLDEQSAARAIETISRNARAQNQLIADLLDVSRIITGKLRFEAGAVNLKTVIEAALETVRPAAEAKGVELRLTLDPTVGKVSGDADRLQQVVWNLLSNAIKYTPSGGHIETRLEREGAHAAIIVRDFGEGISPDFLPYVFARFRQADGTTTRKHSGLGLGLSIVRHLVEAHGGQVRVSSEGAGQGTTFIVTLPLIAVQGEDREAEHADASDTQLPSPKTLEGLRVLVVDDEADVRELLRFVLTDSGAEIRTVASAAEALNLLAQWQPEVLVSDIGMPDVDGYELLRQLRALPAERGGQVPAVALTGYARPEDERRALKAGYQLFVPKPVDMPELEAAIASLAPKSSSWGRRPPRQIPEV